MLARGAWDRRVARRLAWVDQRPFPITGVRGYLAAGRPMIDVRFQTAPKAATVIAGIRGHDPEAEVTQIDDQTFRVVLRGGRPADEPELRRFVDEVLVPVDGDLGVESVNLGGKRVTLAMTKPEG